MIALLAKAQASFKKVTFDSEARMREGGKPYKYASLRAILDAVLPALNAHGIWVSQAPSYADGVLTITTTLQHAEGSIASSISYPLANPTFHGLGSAITYLKRYSLASILGVAADEDEDGHGANGSTPSPAAEARTPPHEPPAAGDPLELVFEGNLEDVRAVPTKNGGTKYGASIMGHGWASSFDDKIGKALHKLIGRRISARVVKDRSGKYWNIVDFVEVTPSGGTVDRVAEGIPF